MFQLLAVCSNRPELIQTVSQAGNYFWAASGAPDSPAFRQWYQGEQAGNGLWLTVAEHGCAAGC